MTSAATEAMTAGALERFGDTPTLRKHVAAVHSTGLGLLQKKLFNVLLLNAYDTLLEVTTQEIPVTALKALINYNSKDHGALREALRAIRQVPVEFNLLEDGKESGPWTITGLISEATLDGGVCTYSFGPKMAEALYQPEVYVMINLRVMQAMTSSFSLSLYENTARFRKVGSTGWIAVSTWRKLLGATADLYDSFRHLNTRVVQPAIKECNAKSDLTLTMEAQRQPTKGRPVTHLRFLIEENRQQALIPFPVDQYEALRRHPAYQKLRDLQISERLALHAVNEDPEWAAGIAQYVDREHKRGKVKAPAAYASKLIRDKAELSDAQRGSEKKAKKADTPLPPSAPAVSSPNAESSADSLIKRMFEASRRELALSRLSPGERLEWIKRWQEYAREREAFLLGGCDITAGVLTPPAQSAFERFLVRNTLGDPTDAEMKRWIASKVSA